MEGKDIRKSCLSGGQHPEDRDKRVNFLEVNKVGSSRIHSGESVIAWVDRCGHAVAGMLQGLSRKASRSAVKTGTSCARAVAMSERMRQKALSPRMLRQLPLIFAWSL